MSQIEDRNQTLSKDNAKLLQRWLDAKQAEANRMNEANQFYEDMKSRRAMQDKENTPGANGSESGNGQGTKEGGASTTTDGTPSQAGTDLSLTPNG